MTAKKVFMIKGLDCANCASKIERALNHLEGVTCANIDFMAGRLYLESPDDAALAHSIHQAKLILQKMEPGSSISEKLAVRVKRPSKCEECSCGCGCGNHHAHHHGEDEETHHSHDGEVEAHQHTHNQEAQHSHTHAPNNDGDRRLKIAQIAGSAVLLVLGMALPVGQVIQFVLFLVSYLIIGGEIVFSAIKNICKGQVFDENFLMSIATIGAFLIGEYAEGVAVMLFFQVGELFQSYAVSKSRKNIKGLMDIRPDYANLKRGDSVEKVAPEQVEVNDIILVKPGEKIPLDGVVLEGNSMLDTSALTGESVPREAGPDTEVLSGCINMSGVITVRVSKAFGESTVSKILDLVENASSKKSKQENFITKFSKYYTPIVVAAAALLAVVPPLVTGDAFSEWIYRALSFLVVSCPCALVISIPLSFFGGIGGASKHGILIKGSNYLEALSQTKTVVFDKTGTLTKGVFQVSEIHAQQCGEEHLLEIAAMAESYSNHPISRSILTAYGREIEKSRVQNYQELFGFGVSAEIDGAVVLAGNPKLMKQHNIDYPNKTLAGTVVHVAISGIYAGYLLISDEIKEDAPAAIKQLKALGIQKTVMLTGDAKAVGEQVGNALGLDEVYTELLPGDKVEQLEQLLENTEGKLAFVGDGINDAPVLSRADIGIAMGGVGSDAAIEAADIVIMTDEPSKISTAIQISKKTLRIVKQNIMFALGIKGIVLILVAFGLSEMWEAVFADVGVSVLAILNAIRALSVKDRKIS